MFFKSLYKQQAKILNRIFNVWVMYIVVFQKKIIVVIIGQLLIKIIILPHWIYLMTNQGGTTPFNATITKGFEEKIPFIICV